MEDVNYKKAIELYPLETLNDQFTQDLRNGIIELLRKAFVEGCEWKEKQIEEFLKK